MTQSSPDMRGQLVAAIPKLRAFAMSLTGNPTLAADLVQDTLVKAWSHRASFRDGTNLRAWLFTILRNTYFTDIRKSRREVQDVDGEAAGRLVSPPEQMGRLDLEDFRRYLAQVSPDQREALLLIGAEGFTYEEAAEICGCAVGTVKSRVNRARVRLVELMGLAPEDVPGAQVASQPKDFPKSAPLRSAAAADMTPLSRR